VPDADFFEIPLPILPSGETMEAFLFQDDTAKKFRLANRSFLRSSKELRDIKLGIRRFRV